MMERYEHGGNVYAHPGCVDFSANINPLGMPQAAFEALRDGVRSFERYPDPCCVALTNAIARAEGALPSWVMCCAGATDAFARICQVLRPRKALLFAPCYSGYEQALEQAGAQVVWQELREADGFALTQVAVEALLPGIDMVFLASPNNPTGRCVEREVLVALLERAGELGATVVLDECFVDLTQREGSVGLVRSYPHLVLVKAFTKTYALAGLRLGYALCSDERMAELMRTAGQLWAVSVPAQVAGVACLGDTGYLERSRVLIGCEREALFCSLVSCGLRPVASEANYLLFRGPTGLAEALLGCGVIIRPCDNYRGLEGSWYRIAVRTHEENALLVAALREVMA